MTLLELRSSDALLKEVAAADADLEAGYCEKLEVNDSLNRALVSFQGNKAASGNRWHAYKEGFSASLVKYLIETVGPTSGRLLEPFAGSGTALFASSDLGLDSLGIELLPSSVETIDVRRKLRAADCLAVANALLEFAAERRWERPGPESTFRHLAITDGAFPAENEEQLGRFLVEVSQLSDSVVCQTLRFAALSILESISYTRKDGQYLRWDRRSGRRGGVKDFYKPEITGFTEAILGKVSQIASDLAKARFDGATTSSSLGQIELIQGSCLEVLPTIDPDSFDGVITSPPYCNRYDYTRTYALELAFLGVGAEALKDLRQAMLSSTVENREKEWLSSLLPAGVMEQAMAAFHSHPLLRLILEHLEDCRQKGMLNNNGIPRMVRNYFKEMAILIFETARALKPGAPFAMVNDNVRYQGAHIPVDLILSDFAQQAGFDVERIWVLARGKGNSSQQMAKYGRQELRKCVYVWRKGQTCL